MAVMKWWLTKCYYEPCGLTHLIPSGGPKDMNYTGVAHSISEGTVPCTFNVALELTAALKIAPPSWHADTLLQDNCSAITCKAIGNLGS